MIKFDTLRVMPCLIEVPVNCHSTTPTVDERCNDPAFAAANPDICGSSLRLVLKPNKNMICINSAVQFRAYVLSNGGEELVTQGVTFTTNNPTVLIVGALSGNATGIAGGVATIAVEWQGLTAFATVTVIDSENCCDDTTAGMILVIDNSHSMQSLFPSYGTKMDFAKFFAEKFADDLNTTKDEMAVEKFNTAGTVTQSFTSVVATIKSAILAIPSTTNPTNVFDALEEAINTLNGNPTPFGQRVIILISDGENKQGQDPIPLASQFISTGGVIQVVGVRAHGDGYELLSKIASGGMFVNAYDADTASDAIDLGRGMKGYYCAGNCTPPGDVIVNVAQLTFEDFINWDVLGPVDLIGGTPPYDQFNLLPGNGLYVDSHGSGPPWLGHMRSKETFTFEAGEEYELIVHLAGNQRTDSGTHTTKFKIGSLLDEDITMDWKDDFEEHTFLFTPGAASEMIEMIAQTPTGTSPYGNLWGYIRLRNVTTDVVLFEDDFDDENPTYIAPQCGEAEIPDGYGTGYAYGYSCYGYGCLTDPVPQQNPDPDPPVDLEA